jgi:hypothetical protein
MEYFHMDPNRQKSGEVPRRRSAAYAERAVPRLYLVGAFAL